jgi:hypothetical protein
MNASRKSGVAGTIPFKNVGQDERAVARHGSRPLKLRVLRLQPLPAVSARISAAGALRDDPLQAQLARLREHERSLGHQGVTEQDAVDAGDEGRKCGSPFLDRTLTEILAVEV